MTNEEKTSLKAACLQAATTLIAARDSVRGREGSKAAPGRVNRLLNRTSSYLARPHQASLRAR